MLAAKCMTFQHRLSPLVPLTSTTDDHLSPTTEAAWTSLHPVPPSPVVGGMALTPPEPSVVPPWPHHTLQVRKLPYQSHNICRSCGDVGLLVFPV